MFLGQFAITTITWFFLTWFPVYLVQDRGDQISRPVHRGAARHWRLRRRYHGRLLSDLLAPEGWSAHRQRKTPIVAGLLLASAIVACNYVESSWLIVALMSLAFFGKGFGALGWGRGGVSDAPKEISGLGGGVFNTFGAVAAITTPIVIGYLVGDSGSFDWALVFVGACASVEEPPQPPPPGGAGPTVPTAPLVPPRLPPAASASGSPPCRYSSLICFGPNGHSFS